MSDAIAVVKPHYAAEEAYDMAYDEFSSLTGEEADDFDLGPFTGTARWANVILPKLRAMAGYADGGHGTYQIHRQVAAVVGGCEEDEPAEAELTEAQYVFGRLVDAYHAGAYDGATGADRYPADV